METEKFGTPAPDRNSQNTGTSGQLILVVDGGRTHLRLILFDRAGEIIARSRQQGLPLTLSETDWAELLIESAARLAAGQEKTLEEICIASAGLAGLGRKEDCDLLAQSLADGGSPFPWLIESDGHMALRAAAETGPVVLCLLGTGSVFFARDQEGNLHRTGGWGALFEDAGSGFEIARQALLQIFRIEDGLEDNTTWRRCFLDAGGFASVQALRGELYRASAEVSEWAGFAPLVLSLAESGEPAACAVVEGQVQKVCRCVGSLIQKADLPPGAAIVSAGGLVQGSSFYFRVLQEALQSTFPEYPARILDKETFWGGWIRARTWMESHLHGGAPPK